MDGPQVCKEVRKRAARRALRAYPLPLTARSQKEDFIVGMERRVLIDYLTKLLSTQ